MLPVLFQTVGVILVPSPGGLEAQRQKKGFQNTDGESIQKLLRDHTNTPGTGVIRNSTRPEDASWAPVMR